MSKEALVFFRIKQGDNKRTWTMKKHTADLGTDNVEIWFFVLVFYSGEHYHHRSHIFAMLVVN